MIAASISPASKAAMAKGLRGMRMNCMSTPYFLNKLRSRATQTWVMLSLVTLDDRLDLVWANNKLGAQTIDERTTMSAQKPPSKSLPRRKSKLVIGVNSLSPFVVNGRTGHADKPASTNRDGLGG